MLTNFVDNIFWIIEFPKYFCNFEILCKYIKPRLIKYILSIYLSFTNQDKTDL